MNPIRVVSLMILAFGPVALAPSKPNRPAKLEHADRTTDQARKLALSRIETIAEAASCRHRLTELEIDLDRLRRTVRETRFYSAVGSERELRFSEAVGLLASPDQTLRALASQVQADAFVLGYQDGQRYVRTRHVVLNRGYFEQPDAETGASRPTTEEEKQSLLLHELLHIALNKDDDALNQRDLCPLRLLTFCPRTPGPSTASE